MNIRNFAIVAHVDHGKSTLADRMLEKTGVLKFHSLNQALDTMELERERGITIKLNPARMYYQPRQPENRNISQYSNPQSLKTENYDLKIASPIYQLNLVDTPGHVDFAYEVSRSLAAVEGVLLLVDASQGVQAQTLSHLQLVESLGLKIIPVVNKIDLPTADLEATTTQLTALLKCQKEDICYVSAKTGQGVDQLLEAIINRIPPAKDLADRPFRALVFDSLFDPFLGVVAYVKVVDGKLGHNQRLQMKATQSQFDCLQLGYLQLKRIAQGSIGNGEIGYIATGLKTVQDCRVGDTIVASADTPALPGYQEAKPMIFASFFPDPGKERQLTVALEKLKLTDASLSYSPVHSQALGQGYTVGFLGLLHLDIIKERLAREFDIVVLVTTPTVAYQLSEAGDPSNSSGSPLDFARGDKEPWVDLEVVGPIKYYGAISELAAGRRCQFVGVDYAGDRVVAHFEAPLAEIIVDFYDTLKSITSGYASMDYQLKDYRPVDLVAVDLIIAGDIIDALRQYMVRSKAERYGRQIVKKLKELIPRQNFEVSIQAAIGGKIIARADISPLRKDVTAKLYGGDVTRKRKLLEKQKKGKKRMRTVGRVELPSEVFVELLRQN